MPLRYFLTTSVMVMALACPLWAEAPNLKTPAPVIYLADNLDEKDQLGWCIDTLGRGFAERLQAHSCKPQGGDVQFSFDADTGTIASVAYEGYCMAHAPDAQTTFALTSCDAAAANQRFDFDPQAGTLHPTESPAHCVSVGYASRSAGPFMSRTLDLTDCEATDKALKEWVISNGS